MEEILIKKIKPMFTRILLTKDTYNEAAYIPGTHLLDSSRIKQGVKELQTVLAIGDAVRNVKVGDKVVINPMRYATHKYRKDELKEAMEEYNNTVVNFTFPTVIVDGKECLYLDERDIDFVVEDYTILNS